MHGSQEEEREAGHRLHPPERCVFMAQHSPMAAKVVILTKIRRELPHGQTSVEYKHHRNQCDHARDNGGVGSAKKELALEHLRDPPHRILADQDARDESHMAPHKQTEEQTAGALNQIQPGGPTTFSPLLIQSDPGNDTDFVGHCASLSTASRRTSSCR